jgi:hypothetical protein
LSFGRQARSRSLLGTLLALSLLVGVVSFVRVLTTRATDSWALSGWGYRKQITISHTNVDSDLTDFPLLVKISGDTDIGAHARSDGYDLRFTLADGTSLPYEREDFSITGGAATGDFWVKVPTISSSADTTIYAFYGKSDASDGSTATAVWDSNFKGVWHLPNGTTLSANDSTSNGNNGTINGATAATTGQVDGAGSFDGVNDYMDAGSNAIFENTDNHSVEAWIKSTKTGWQFIAGYYNYGASDDGYSLCLTTDGKFGLIESAHTNWQYATSTTSYAGDNQLHHVVGVRRNGTAYVYVDGVQQPTTTTLAPTFSNSKVIIGWQGFGAQAFGGFIDEIRFSSTARSAAWIKFEYNNMASATNELTFAAQEAGTTPTVSSVTSTTADGTYGSGSTVAVAVTFSEAVTVTGTPQLTLETGTNDTVVNYASGNGTTTLTFNYRVRDGDSSSDLDYKATDSLALNGGTIKSSVGIDATLTLSSPGAAGSLGANKALVIDGVAPVITSVTSNGSKTDALITWTTVEAGSSQVEYGLTNSYGSLTTETDTVPRVSSHSVSLSNLTCATTYHYRVKSTDAAGNTATGSDGTVSTTSCNSNGGAAAANAQRKELQTHWWDSLPGANQTSPPGAAPAPAPLPTQLSTPSPSDVPSPSAGSPSGESLTGSDNGTVSDATTGLLWQHCPLGQIGSGCAGGVALRATKTGAEQYCTKLGIGWRLPTVEELFSITNHETSIPAIDQAAFPLTPSIGFWSASPYVQEPGSAWYVDFKSGTALFTNSSTNYAVRCVQSGS